MVNYIKFIEFIYCVDKVNKLDKAENESNVKKESSGLGFECCSPWGGVVFFKLLVGVDDAALPFFERRLRRCQPRRQQTKR
jgi:hypothetical protein